MCLELIVFAQLDISRSRALTLSLLIGVEHRPHNFVQKVEAILVRNRKRGSDAPDHVSFVFCKQKLQDFKVILIDGSES